jgi:ATP-dependent protease Clp ATPase subunit
MFRRAVSCSFCGRSRAEVAELVSGPGVRICAGCVAAAAKVLDGQPLDRSQYIVVRSRFPLRLLRWLRRTLSRNSRVRTPGAPREWHLVHARGS